MAPASGPHAAAPFGPRPRQRQDQALRRSRPAPGLPRRPVPASLPARPVPPARLRGVLAAQPRFLHSLSRLTPGSAPTAPARPAVAASGPAAATGGLRPPGLSTPLGTAERWFLEYSSRWWAALGSHAPPRRRPPAGLGPSGVSVRAPKPGPAKRPASGGTPTSTLRPLRPDDYISSAGIRPGAPRPIAQQRRVLRPLRRPSAGLGGEIGGDGGRRETQSAPAGRCRLSPHQRPRLLALAGRPGRRRPNLQLPRLSVPKSR